MDRRKFIKGMGVLAIGGTAALGGWSLDRAFDLFGADQSSRGGGLLLQPELYIEPTLSGAMVFYKEQLAFEVNEAGVNLLKLADGTHSLAQIVSLCGYDEAETAAFFVTLGEAGYLLPCIEVNIIETHV